MSSSSYFERHSTSSSHDTSLLLQLANTSQSRRSSTSGSETNARRTLPALPSSNNQKTRSERSNKLSVLEMFSSKNAKPFSPRAQDGGGRASSDTVDEVDVDERNRSRSPLAQDIILEVPSLASPRISSLRAPFDSLRIQTDDILAAESDFDEFGPMSSFRSEAISEFVSEWESKHREIHVRALRAMARADLRCTIPRHETKHIASTTLSGDPVSSQPQAFKEGKDSILLELPRDEVEFLFLNVIMIIVWK